MIFVFLAVVIYGYEAKTYSVERKALCPVLEGDTIIVHDILKIVEGYCSFNEIVLLDGSVLELLSEQSSIHELTLYPGSKVILNEFNLHVHKLIIYNYDLEKFAYLSENKGFIMIMALELKNYDGEIFVLEFLDRHIIFSYPPRCCGDDPLPQDDCPLDHPKLVCPLEACQNQPQDCPECPDCPECICNCDNYNDYMEIVPFQTNYHRHVYFDTDLSFGRGVVIMNDEMLYVFETKDNNGESNWYYILDSHIYILPYSYIDDIIKIPNLKLSKNVGNIDKLYTPSSNGFYIGYEDGTIQKITKEPYQIFNQYEYHDGSFKYSFITLFSKGIEYFKGDFFYGKRITFIGN